MTLTEVTLTQPDCGPIAGPIAGRIAGPGPHRPTLAPANAPGTGRTVSPLAFGAPTGRERMSKPKDKSAECATCGGTYLVMRRRFGHVVPHQRLLTDKDGWTRREDCPGTKIVKVVQPTVVRGSKGIHYRSSGYHM